MHRFPQRKPSFTAHQIAVLAWFTLVVFYAAVTISGRPDVWRRRRVLNNIDEFSQLISLESLFQDSDFEEFAETLRIMEEPPFIIFIYDVDGMLVGMSSGASGEGTIPDAKLWWPRGMGEPNLYTFEFDSSNLDVTLNHLCNLKYMPGAMERTTFVAFEQKAQEELRVQYPNVPIYLADFTPVKRGIPADKENRGYIIYQLILLWRARIARALVGRGVTFWAMQQDSLWIENFANMAVEKKYPDANLIFDVVGNDQVPDYYRMRGWICGSTFFVRANPTTAHFFDKLDLHMRTKQSPDSSIMTYLCGFDHYKCVKMPRWIVSSSNYFLGLRETLPILLQVDSDQSKISKMDLFRREKFIFRHPNGTCDAYAVANLRVAVTNAMLDEIAPAFENNETLLKYIYHELKWFFNVDAYNNKVFMTVHYGLI